MSSLARISLVSAAVALSLTACTDSPTAPVALQRSPNQPLLDMAAPQPSVARYEVYYTELTIDHHLAGIAEATLCVERAVHPELKAMCEQSIASQQQQIEQLRTWLQEWYGIEYAGEIVPSAQQDIRRLAELSGATFEDEFLTDFSKHHLRIIKESEKAVRKVYHDQLRVLAQSIITAQSESVIQMQTWDCQWYGDCRQGIRKQAERA